MDIIAYDIIDDIRTMSDSSTSDRYNSDIGSVNILSAMSPNTPLTSIASPDALTIDTSEESKRSRRNSNVHFREFRSLSGEAGQASSLPTSRGAYGPQLEKGEWSKAPPQPYVEILEDKLNMLENRLQHLELPRPADFSEKGDSSSERSGLNVEPQWMTWQEYLEPTNKASNILEVLIEKPHTNTRRRSSVIQPATEASSGPLEVKNIERIRFRSSHIISALQQITEQTFPNLSCFTIHRPFKILLFYRDAIEDYVSDLEENFRRITSCPLGDQCKARFDYGKPTLGTFPNYPPAHEDNHIGIQGRRRAPFEDDSQPSGQVIGDNHDFRSMPERQHNISEYARRQQNYPSADLNESECKHEESDDLLAQSEAITHLRALLKFMRDDMREIFTKHDLLRSSKADNISFIDIWHLFMAGDLVVTNDESDRMMYRVSILPAHSFFSSRRPVKEMKLRSDGNHQQVESVYSQESMNVMNIDVYYYNFDGRSFGPVERRYVDHQAVFTSAIWID